ncbi:uncharacterized protein LOC115877109 isoform X1 [Sitophilus oryzae]|uniref:Uncharacterized protein LOC115877109 isoform X1 n=2 Tax=Sitophilus oryzae TaxID=7048 RepID=A0A6J2XD37_SITOR|nr:uncharacterized protein LOC115877109 isoform X1 [Sitophilus oryzae]
MRVFSAIFLVIMPFVDVADSIFISRMPCRDPEIKNGRARLKQRGRWAKFICAPSYTLVGERTAYCRNGVWDITLPKCVGSSCPKPGKIPVNSVMLAPIPGALNFYCQPGYSMTGPKTLYCDGKTWDNHMPACIASNEKAPLFCDFEKSDICYWNHDLNHDMDWTRGQYKTPTGYSMPTGPSHDHTKGFRSNGYYMYLETSSRRVNDTARLISPIFPKTNTIGCLEFWYHMHGRTIGTLRAYFRKTSEPWSVDPDKAIFTKTGNHGDVWLRAFIELGNMTEDYQIIMEGTRGNGYVSDIAIDDINIIENCVYSEYTTTTEENISTTTEILKPIESCENRCGNKATSEEKAQYLACDCDEFCGESSRCCPDYVDFCFDVSTTAIIEANTTNTAIPEIEQNILNTLIPVIKNDTKLPVSLTSNQTTNVYVQLHTKTTSTTTRIPTTKNTTKVVLEKETIPPLVLLQPTTSQIIYRKYFAPTKSTTKPKKVVLPDKKLSENDIGTIPIRQNISDVNATPLPLDENIPINEKEKYVEKVAKEAVLNENQSPENLDKLKTGFSQKQDEYSHTKLIFIIIAVLCGVSSVTILIVLAVLKYRTSRYRRRMTSGNGDSQSDVRFLTADEVLDFSLDKDYEDL